MLDPDDSMGTVWMSIMPCDCVCSYGASKAVWQALMDTKKKLDICEGALEEYKEWFNKSQERLKIAVDALEWIAYDKDDEQDGLEEFAISQMVEKADKAIEQINEITKGNK